ncbi:26365_t:CDS:2, partial [Racocetra persica]
DTCTVAESRDGQYLSENYINNHTPLRWKYAKYHEWNYPQCSGYSKLNIDIAIDIAHYKGGKCLSEKYIDINSPLLWECTKGHQWNTNLRCVRNLNTWCPYCSGRYSCNLELAKKVANAMGGDCLSEKYINAITPLL